MTSNSKLAEHKAMADIVPFVTLGSMHAEMHTARQTVCEELPSAL